MGDSVNKEYTAGDLQSAVIEENGSIAELQSWGARVTTVEGIGDFSTVPGSEFSYGDGHETGFVVQDVNSKRYFLASGIYSSWDSTEYDDLEEVEPVQVTVTRFKNVVSGAIHEDPTLGELSE